MEQVATRTGSSATREWRMHTYPRVFLAAVGAAFVLVVALGSGSSTVSGRVGGDFPAFYAAGSLVVHGQDDNLYDPTAQAAAQHDLLGSEGGFLAFAYAPQVALAYAPLSLLDYRLAYVVHTALMAAALVAAMILIRPLVAVIDRWFALTIAAMIGFYPIFMAIGGGQNTAVTLLLLTWMWRSLADGHQARAGIAVALLIFRPQYALPVMALLFLGRHFGAVGWAAVGMAATWTIDAVMLGPMWVPAWLERVGPFVSTDARINGHNAIAIIGFLQALLGVDSSPAIVVGGLLSLTIATILAAVWWTESVELDLVMALTATGLVLMSPHTMFYDAGIIVITLAVLINRDPGRWPLVPIMMIAAIAQVAAPAIGFSPFAPVVAAVFLLTLREVRANATAGAPLEMVTV